MFVKKASSAFHSTVRLVGLRQTTSQGQPEPAERQLIVSNAENQPLIARVYRWYLTNNASFKNHGPLWRHLATDTLPILCRRVLPSSLIDTVETVS